MRRDALMSYLTALSLGLASACASGDPPVAAEDMGDTTTEEDMSSSPAEDMSEPVEDMRPEPEDMAPEEMGPEPICAADETRCAADGSLETCAADRLSWDAQMCPEGEECQAGACVTAPICQEGESTCFDEMTRQFCRPGGMAFGTETCPENTACIQGQCVSGEVNGTLCSTHDDCSGGKCHCGEATAEGCADAFAAPAYCTSQCSDATQCSDAEACFAADVHLVTSQVANYNHCVTKCQGSCSIEGMSCKQVPVYDAAGELSWQEACYFPGVKEIGEDCTTDAECLGGYCLKDYFSTGYCSRRCETGGCPDNAACVELVPGEQWCSLKCGDGSVGSSAKCPLDLPDDRLDVTCSIKQVKGGGVARVCTDT